MKIFTSSFGSLAGPVERTLVGGRSGLVRSWTDPRYSLVLFCVCTINLLLDVVYDDIQSPLYTNVLNTQRAHIFHVVFDRYEADFNCRAFTRLQCLAEQV